MAKIVRKLFEGTGNSTIDVTGMSFAKVEYSGSLLTLNFNLVSPNASTVGLMSTDGRVTIPAGVTSAKVICGPSSDKWKISLQSTIPAVNQSELKISKLENGQYNITGDDDLVFKGQDTDPATVDITGLSRNLETLSQLYMKASATKTVTDAAKYVKMKNLITQ